jgi:hypothetical protein
VNLPEGRRGEDRWNQCLDALTAAAHCIGRCEWTAGPGPAADVDRAAKKHVSVGHPTAVVAELGGPKAGAA